MLIFYPKTDKINMLPPKLLLHPQRDLGLEEITCNEQIIEQCGIEIIRIVDEDMGKLVCVSFP